MAGSRVLAVFRASRRTLGRGRDPLGRGEREAVTFRPLPPTSPMLHQFGFGTTHEWCGAAW